jgi:hypothetical protein
MSLDGGAAVDAQRNDVVRDDGNGAATTDPDLVAWWAFDEVRGTVLHDISGHDNNGTLTGGTSWVVGKVGPGALAFDGLTGRVLVPWSPSLQSMTSHLTVAMWIYVVAAPPAQPRLMQVSGAWDIKLNNGAPQLSASPRYGIVDWHAPIAVWHHIALVYDGGVLSGYVDRVLTPLGTNQFSNSDPLPIGDTGGLSLGGVLPGGTDESCECQLDDVRIYRRALSASEIAALP